MNAFTDLTDEQQVLELVHYTAVLLEKPKFQDENVAKVEAGNLFEVLKELVGHSHLYFTGPQEIESIFNSMARLVRIFKPEETAELVRSLSAALTKEDVKGHELSRLKVLGNLFNNLEANSPSRYDTYLHVVGLAGRSGNIEAIQPQFSQLDSWMKQWGVSVEQKRALYLTLYEVLKKAGFRKEATQFLITYLKSFNDASAAELAKVKPTATTLITEVLNQDDMLEVANVLALNAVQQLKGQDIFTLIDLYNTGGLEKFGSWMKAHESAVKSLGFDVAALERKVRLMALTNLCANNSVLTFDTIAKTLNVEEDVIESWIIDVIRAGLVEAKIDELNKKVIVSRSTHTEFEQSQWGDLKERLVAWQTNIGDIESAIDRVKSLASKQSHGPTGR